MTDVSYYSNYEFINQQKDIQSIINDALKCKEVTVDTETTSLDIINKDFKLLLFQLGFDGKAYVIDARKVNITPFKEVLSNRSIVKNMHHANYDYKAIKYTKRFRTINMYDTLIVEKLLSAGISSKTEGKKLGDLEFKYLHLSRDKSLGAEFPNFDYENGEFTDAQIQYAGIDVLTIPEIKRFQMIRVKELRLNKTANIEFSIIESVATMELTGSLLDDEKWKKSLVKASEAREDYKGKIKYFLKDPLPPPPKPIRIRKDGQPYKNQAKQKPPPVLNLASWQQLSKALAIFGVDLAACKEVTRDGLTSEATVKYALSRYGMDKNKAIVLQNLLKFKGVNKILSSFGYGLIGHIKHDGRIHATFDPLGTSSGRFSCSKPNLQQIPKKGELGEILRSCFIAPKNHKLIIADYSQVELRIVAEMSGDENMIKTLNQPDGDMHTGTASLMFNVPYADVTEEQRDAAKTLNFGIIYGMSVFSLAQRLECTEEKAKKLMGSYRDAYPTMIAWIEEEGRAAFKRGWSKTLAGRYRWFPKLVKPKRNDWEGNKEYRGLKGYYERVGKNHPIQGTSAEITKEALALLFEPLMKYNAVLINTVHDEVAAECPEKYEKEVAILVRDCMMEAGAKYLKKVPTLVEVKISTCWYKGGEDTEDLDDLIEKIADL